jgi:hypothetical protein
MPVIHDISDDQWILNLAAEAAYAQLDIEGELESFLRWTDEHEVVATRSRFLSWINKAEPPLSLLSKRQKKEREQSINVYDEPPNWRTLLGPAMGQYDRWVLDQPWPAIRCTHGRKIWIAVLDMQAKGAQGLRV